MLLEKLLKELMLANFKIPLFQPQVTTEDIFEWLRNLFGRWSATDLVLVRLFPIGTWDMDATPSITLNLGNDIDIKRIIGIKVIITNDDEDKRYDGSLVAGGFDSVRAEGTDIILIRTSGGFFDNTDFNDILVDRGDVSVCYTT